MIPDKAQKVIQLLLEGGARDALVVGGFVRDSLLGIESNNDVDIEVYGLDYEQIVGILSPHFHRVQEQGKSFGIVSVDNDIDVGVPRREKKNGRGHKGFDVELDPSMSFEEAAARRDFTINAMAMRADGSLLDPFNGQQDFRDRWLRPTSEAFAEDPVRILRGMQFAGRFNFRLHPSAVEMCKAMRSEFHDIFKERIWKEWHKWAMLSIRPSAGLQFLNDAGWIHFFPEINHIQGILQDEQWHPEGDVWIHTLHVVDAAHKIAVREQLDENDRLALMFAALGHDFGKAHRDCWQWEAGRIRAKGHEGAGVPKAERFMERIHAPKWIIEHISPLIKEHLAYAGAEPKARVVRRLALRLQPSNLRMWSMLVESDHSGRPPLPPSNPAEGWDKVAVELNVQNDGPDKILRGRDLIALGMSPGKEMGLLLDEAFEAQLEGAFDNLEDAIQWAKQRA